MTVKRFLSVMLVGLIFLMVGCQTGKIEQEPSGGVNEGDRALQWRQLGFSDSDVESVRVSDDGRVYALTAGDLYIMEDEGWEKLDFDHVITTFYLMERAEGVTIVAGTDSGHVFTLPQGSNTWVQGSVDTVGDAIDIITGSSASGIMWMGQSAKEGGGLWKSSDGGITWNKLTDITVRGIAFHPKQNDVLYIVDKLTYVSTDGGKNWAKLDTGANYGVLIHPLRPDIAYLAYARGVVTADHQGMITSKHEFYLPGGMTRLEYNPVDPDEWALGMWDFPSGTGGLYYTTDGGNKWAELEQLTGVKITDLSYSNDGKVLYIATEGKGLWRLDVEGLTHQK